MALDEAQLDRDLNNFKNARELLLDLEETNIGQVASTIISNFFNAYNIGLLLIITAFSRPKLVWTGILQKCTAILMYSPEYDYLYDIISKSTHEPELRSILDCTGDFSNQYLMKQLYLKRYYLNLKMINWCIILEKII